MEFKDYYEILGVSPNAEQKAIKDAYRKLARQHHPDVNPGDKNAEEKFKNINEAYQALSNAEARKKYDTLREQYLNYQRRGGRPQDFNWGNWAAQPGEGVHVQYATPEDMEDLFGAESPFSDFFSTIFGQAGSPTPGSRAAGGRRAPRPRRGRDVEYEVDLTLEEAFHGTSRLLQIGDRRIEAQIPPGVRTGSRVRLAGQGEPGTNGGPAGDLYLVPRVAPHPAFERQGDDLYTQIPVDLYTAILGGEVRVPILEGALLLRIPPRTQADRSFRLRGKGMPRLGQPQERGDLFARVKLVLPEGLSEREIEAIRELAAERQGSSSQVR